MSADAPQIATGNALDNLSEHAERPVLIAVGLIQQMIAVDDNPKYLARQLRPIAKRLNKALVEFLCCRN